MDLDELRAFVAVAETGSMTQAARSLGFARATFRRRIDELEARVGAPLLERSPRGVRLTPAGEVLAERGRALLEETSLLLAQARSLGSDPAGMVHILLPLGLPPHAVATTLGLLRGLHPALSFEIRHAPDPLAAVLEGVDLFGFFAPPETRPGSAWITYELASAPQRLFASPSYLEQRGTPAAPVDLASHAILLWQPPGPAVRSVTLAGETVTIEPLVVSRDLEQLLASAALGHGIACVPEGGLDLSHLGGSLVPVLPELEGPGYDFCLAVSRALAELPKILAVVRFAERAIRLAQPS